LSTSTISIIVALFIIFIRFCTHDNKQREQKVSVHTWQPTHHVSYAKNIMVYFSGLKHIGVPFY